MLRTGGVLAVVSNSVDDNDLEVLWGFMAGIPGCSSAAWRTGLKDKLLPGVVGAVETSRLTSFPRSRVEGN